MYENQKENSKHVINISYQQLLIRSVSEPRDVPKNNIHNKDLTLCYGYLLKLQLKRVAYPHILMFQ